MALNSSGLISSGAVSLQNTFGLDTAVAYKLAQQLWNEPEDDSEQWAQEGHME